VPISLEWLVGSLVAGGTTLVEIGNTVGGVITVGVVLKVQSRVT
jgi:hypothetical protein